MFTSSGTEKSSVWRSGKTTMREKAIHELRRKTSVPGTVKQRYVYEISVSRQFYLGSSDRCRTDRGCRGIKEKKKGENCFAAGKPFVTRTPGAVPAAKFFIESVHYTRERVCSHVRNSRKDAAEKLQRFNKKITSRGPWRWACRPLPPAPGSVRKVPWRRSRRASSS